MGRAEIPSYESMPRAREGERTDGNRAGWAGGMREKRKRREKKNAIQKSRIGEYDKKKQN